MARPGPPLKLTATEQAELARRYAACESTTELGVAYGVSARTVRKILALHDVDTRLSGDPGKLTDDDHAAIAIAYTAETSAAELAERFGVARSTIRRSLIRTDTPRRAAGPVRRADAWLLGLVYGSLVPTSTKQPRCSTHPSSDEPSTSKP